jgi:hypothetical protein
MLHIDEDDLFVGSPRSKFFDILFNANKSVVEDVMTKHIERHVAMEQLLEQLASRYEIDIEQELSSILYEKQDDVLIRKTDFFIATVGDVLTQNE